MNGNEEMNQKLIALRKENHRLRGELLRLEALRTIGEFTAAIVHNIKNMLVVNLGYMDFAMRENNVELLTPAIKAGRKVESMINFLMRTVGNHKQQKERVDIKALLDELVDVICRGLFGRVIISAEIPDHLPKILGDKIQIEQAIFNLLKNAKDALAERTSPEIRISARKVETGGSQWDGIDQLNCGHILLTIEDNGKGMSETTRARIFEPFFTTKSVGRGTGIGLASVLETIKDHGGAIRCQSQPEIGTQFRVFLPIPAEEMSIAQTEKKMDVGGQGSGELILVVEDELEIRNNLKMLLEINGYRVLTAGNGKDAICILEKEQKVDLAILDIKMPVMDGLEMLDAYQWGHTKIIFCTAYHDRDTRGYHTIHKPFQIEKVLKTIREHLVG